MAPAISKTPNSRRGGVTGAAIVIGVGTVTGRIAVVGVTVIRVGEVDIGAHDTLGVPVTGIGDRATVITGLITGLGAPAIIVPIIGRMRITGRASALACGAVRASASGFSFLL